MTFVQFFPSTLSFCSTSSQKADNDGDDDNTSDHQRSSDRRAAGQHDRRRNATLPLRFAAERDHHHDRVIDGDGKVGDGLVSRRAAVLGHDDNAVETGGTAGQRTARGHCDDARRTVDVERRVVVAAGDVVQQVRVRSTVCVHGFQSRYQASSLHIKQAPTYVGEGCAAWWFGKARSCYKVPQSPAKCNSIQRQETTVTYLLNFGTPPYFSNALYFLHKTEISAIIRNTSCSKYANRYFPYWKIIFLSSIFLKAVAQKLCGGFC